MKNRWKRMIVIAPLAVIGMVLFTFLGGEIVKQLWNWLLPSIVGWRQITFWEALGLLVLCRILFGGFGARGSTRAHVRRRVEERCEQMTPEERERFRQSLRARWGFGPPAGESKTPSEP